MGRRQRRGRAAAHRRAEPRAATLRHGDRGQDDGAARANQPALSVQHAERAREPGANRAAQGGADRGAARSHFFLRAGLIRTALDDRGRRAQLIESYLQIEKTRFEQKLNFTIDCPPTLSGCLIPPMILQPLVENAIKHGIGKKLEGGTVRVEVRRNETGSNCGSATRGRDSGRSRGAAGTATG